jgi:DNA polymerase-3 subunit alpha
MSSIAITDHGYLHGVVEFYKACKKNEVKPILGVEAYITNDTDNSAEHVRDNFHLVLLAKSLTGWKNLVWLSTNAALNNFYYKPRINKQLLKEHSEGLIALSGCLGGETSETLFSKGVDEAERIIEEYKESFVDSFFLEMQDPSNIGEKQELLNRFLKAMHKKHKIPLALTADAHFLKCSDTDIHNLIMAIQLKKTLTEYMSGDSMHLPATCYVRPSEDMYKLSLEVIGTGEAASNTSYISNMCEDFSLLPSHPLLPKIDIDKDFILWQTQMNQ